MSYEGLRLEPKAALPLLAGEDNIPKRFLLHRIIAEGPWKNVGKSVVDVGIRFTYELSELGQMGVSLSMGKMEERGKPPFDILSVAGSYSYPYKRLEKIIEYISYYRTAIVDFRQVIAEDFLSEIDLDCLLQEDLIFDVR
jgi:hypothetical protein